MAEQTFNGTKINVDFQETATRQGLISGENLSKSLGKISKIISDLKAVAFDGNADTVNNHTVESDVPTNAKFTDTVYTHPTTSGYKHIPSGGTVGQILKNTADGTATWNDLQIGGTNLLLNSAFIGTANWGGADTTALSATSGVLKITPSNKAGTGIYTRIDRIYGDTADKYILTFMAKSDADRSIVVALTGYNGNNTAVYTSPFTTFKVTTEWQRYTVAFDNTNSDVTRFALSFMSSPANTTPFYIKYPMLERGTEATDWSPSPEDMAYASHTHKKADITDFPTIPTKTSQLTNDSGFKTTDTTYTVATKTADGLMSSNDFTKLSNIDVGATKNEVCVFTTTINVADWTTNSNGGYSCIKTISNLLATDIPEVDVVLSTDRTAAMTQLAAFECLCDGNVVVGNDSATFWCYNTKPSVAMNIRLRVVR